MKKWKSLSLEIQYENGLDQFIKQDSGYIADFELHKKAGPGKWVRKYRDSSISSRIPNWSINHEYLRTMYSQSSFGEEVIISGQDYPTLTVNAVDHARGTVTLSSDAGTRYGTTITAARPEPSLTSSAAIRAMEDAIIFGRGEVRIDEYRYAAHRDHIRAHQEVINQISAQAQMMSDRNEVERRSQQRQAEQQRIEQERTRERRPWERVRNFFGQD